MPSWLFSLQFRLVAGFALVLALVLGGVSLYIGQAAGREAERLEGLSENARALRIKQALTDYYERNDGWGGVQPVLDRASFVAGREIVVVDKDGALIGDSRLDKAAYFELGKHFKPYAVGQGGEASVYVGPRRRILKAPQPANPPAPAVSQAGELGHLELRRTR